MESLRKKFFSHPFVLTIIAIVLGFGVASIILLLAGFPPKESILTLVESMIGRPKDIASVIIRSTPIIFTGLGVAFAIKTGLFNIGAEGQYIMGCVVATMVGSMLDFPKPVAVLMVVISAMLVSALYAGFVGLLKAHFGIHEVITSIMLNWIALYFSNWICGLDFFHKPGTIGMYPVNDCTYDPPCLEKVRGRAGVSRREPTSAGDTWQNGSQYRLYRSSHCGNLYQPFAQENEKGL